MSYPPYPVNPVTDSLRLVAYTTVKGGTWDWLLGRDVRTDEGFSQQIFTAAGEYRGEVNQRLSHLSVRDGDLVVKVNLGPRFFEFRGSLAVRDGYTRAYVVRLQLAVQNSQSFALACKQESDPVALLRSAIDGALLRWANQLEHDDITPEAMRYRVTTAAQMAQEQTGLAVSGEVYAAAAISEHHQRLMDIERTHQIDTAQHATQVVVDQWGREKQVADHVVVLEERKKDDEATRLKAIADADAQLIIASRQKIAAKMLEQYDTLLESMTPDEILDQYPQLALTVQGLTTSPSGGLLALGAGAQGSAATDGSSNPSKRTQKTNPQEIYDSGLGVSYRQASLSDAQEDAVNHDPNPSRRDVVCVFEIVRLDEHGPAEKAGLLVGDIIIQVEGKRLQDAQSIKTLALGSPVGGFARVCFLRNGQLDERNVAINR